MEHTYRQLTIGNWDDFYKLFNKHKGVRGGCWCSYYLERPKAFVFGHKEEHMECHKEHVKNFKSTGILMYEGELPVGYCQVARADVIERFDYSRAYAALDDSLKHVNPWRISCIFIDKDYRKSRLASKLFDFAIDYISLNGGGLLEVYPFNHHGGKSRFEFNGSVDFYLKRGFIQASEFGSSLYMMTKEIPSAGR